MFIVLSSWSGLAQKGNYQDKLKTKTKDIEILQKDILEKQNLIKSFDTILINLNNNSTKKSIESQKTEFENKLDSSKVKLKKYCQDFEEYKHYRYYDENNYGGCKPSY